MSSEAKAAELVREIVAPPRPGESVKALIWRAARASGLSAARVKRIWYGEAKSILADEIDALHNAARKKAADRAADDEAGGGNAERNEFIGRLEFRLGSLEEKLATLADEIRRLNRRTG